MLRQSEIPLYLPRHTSAFLLLLAPLVALAQAPEQPGLDLTRPPRAPSQPAAPATPRDAASDAPSVKSAAAAAAGAQPAPLAPGEEDVAFADRVKAVQRKGFLKRHRFEVGLDLPASLNDPFYEKLGVGGKLAYDIEDSFAVAVRGAYYWPLRTDAVRQGKLAFDSQLLNSQLYGQLMVDGIWSPIYGKVAWLGSSIVHFDMYLLAGLGAVWSSTSLAPRSEGPHVGTDVGVGIRFYPRSWLALDGGVTATLYPDQPSQSVPSSIQKLVVAHVGVSFFFPTTFEYVYP